jgi:hypothetical protein
MFQFRMNDAARSYFGRFPRWKVTALAVLGIALGVMLALVAASLFIIIVPILLVGGLLARFIAGIGRPSPASAPDQAADGVVIDGDYRIIEPSSPDDKRPS